MTLRLDSKLKARLKKLADERGESLQAFLVRIVTNSVERDEWLESGRLAQEEFERTRMAIPADAMFDWFRRLAKGEKVPLPRPRYVPRRAEKA